MSEEKTNREKQILAEEIEKIIRENRELIIKRAGKRVREEQRQATENEKEL